MWGLLPAGVPATTTDEDLELRLGGRDLPVRSGLGWLSPGSPPVCEALDPR
ncbi:hypothetical protein WME89_29675 [Sorangium sp. So ce321]|uniref:hypothetical protein n=1 Tax=Sorangium sp. So ce321 TaxID=3133300 RepID=UPI003F642EEC